MSSPLTSALIGQDASVADQSRKEFEAKLGGLGGLGAKNISPEAKTQKLREACEGFESIFIQKMWQEMRNTVPQSGMLHGREERFWQDMYDQELSKSMSKAGGIGLADMMFEQLSRSLGDASRSAAQDTAGGAFVPTAAPLMPSPAVYAQLPEDPPAASLAAESIYEQEAPATGMVPGEAVEELAAASQAVPAGQPATPAAAPQQAQATAHASPKQKATHRTVQPGSHSDRNGMDLAYMASRDAGDKLGAGAVRPAMRKRKEKAQPEPVAAAPAAPAAPPLQGTPDALKAALAAARSNSPSEGEAAGQSLSSIVANLQAQQSVAAAQPVAATASQPDDASMQPVSVRKVRYTTNIPQNNSGKKASEAIRLLNVDNVSVNSKAGQGLAAYHAAQQAEAGRQPEAPSAAANPSPDPAGLTQAASLVEAARQPQAASADAGFAIPPLRASSLHNS